MQSKPLGSGGELMKHLAWTRRPACDSDPLFCPENIHLGLTCVTVCPRRAQERSDGTNVNNWHWTERDVMGWSRGRLGELLGGTRLADTAEAAAKVTGVQDLEGARVGRA